MVEGSCLCGSVKFNLDIDPNTANNEVCKLKSPQASIRLLKIQTKVCHCRPCRKITGGFSSLNLTIPADAFKLTNGTLKTVKSTHVDEGFEFSLTFCPECGSPIYAVPAGPRDIVIIQVGTLDTGGVLERVPTTELNVKHRLGWVQNVEGAKQNEKYT